MRSEKVFYSIFWILLVMRLYIEYLRIWTHVHVKKQPYAGLVMYIRLYDFIFISVTNKALNKLSCTLKNVTLFKVHTRKTVIPETGLPKLIYTHFLAKALKHSEVCLYVLVCMYSVAVFYSMERNHRKLGTFSIGDQSHQSPPHFREELEISFVQLMMSCYNCIHVIEIEFQMWLNCSVNTPWLLECPDK